jgi:D-sedoheptulose 7-phosphate isomerase
LEAVRPDIHCKAGDYTLDALPEATVVRAHGGEVRILPLQAGISTSTVIARITGSAASGADTSASPIAAGVMQPLLDGSNVLRQTAYRLAESLEQVAREITSTLQRGNKLLICGNGGSAADAQHFAAELIGRYQRERPAWPALALTTDSSALTSIANDYGFEQVFARQIAGLGHTGDMLVLISTSGNSKNLLAAAAVARHRGITTLALTGDGPAALSGVCDRVLAVPSRATPLIQQAHIAMIHCLCELIERALSEGNA